MATNKKVTSKKETQSSTEERADTAAEIPVIAQPASVESVDIPLSGNFPVVGIGASAGGLGAFEEFFLAIPADTKMGMAFVLVQHMAPDYKSMLSDILRRYTKMQVYDVKDEMTVKPDCVYVIPPNMDMIIMDGMLHLVEPAEVRGQRTPIDFFLRSLASDQQERSIGILLSGTGSDGTQGVRAIKAEGGMVMVQDPESSEYNGMPLSAIDTGLVDYILKPGEMPGQLRDYVSHMFGEKAHQLSNDQRAMKIIFNQLLSRTGHDFSQYKHKTIDRRIRRRMAINNIKLIEGYANYLQQKPEEIKALFHDLLINVTSFFRNPNVFDSLKEQVIPHLFDGKSANTAIRVWVVGCSTGEEAYSIGILLQEHMSKLKRTFKVQIFATDIDTRTIEQARKGVYTASISADITPERLERFFTHDPELNTYTIQKKIRDMILFSEHDVIKDPPFSKLDLISCRNLLIYMDKEMQKKVIPMFHYALNTGGFLLLGSSESIGEFSYLFDTLDRQSKLYQSMAVNGQYNYPVAKLFPSPRGRSVSKLPPDKSSGKLSVDNKLQLRELTERKLLQHYAPAGALINEHGAILYLHGRTGMYLEVPPGEPGYNILKMARDGLQQELTIALSRVVVNKEQIVRSGLRVKTNGDFTTIDLTLRPVEEIFDQRLFLVTFDEPSELRHSQKGKDIAEIQDIDEENVAALKEELRTMAEYLKNSNEQLEISNEELTSSNEEMQSMNEEMQSTNEELETSREELQSLNEELSTVNAQLQSKVAELSESSEDIIHILASTGMGIIIVDNQLRIQSFTPEIKKVIHLLPTDVGRPIEHVVLKLPGYKYLISDIKNVMSTLNPMEIEVRTPDAEWYTLIMRPYRTIKNTIGGVVITFQKQTESLRRLAAVVNDSGDAITLQDMGGRILAWNPMAEKIYGWSEEEALTMNINSMILEGQKEEALDLLKKLSKAEILKPYLAKRITKDGRIIDIWLTATPLIDADGNVYSIATTERIARQ
jgi:two-component system CheB/CheR fusion protein